MSAGTAFPEPTQPAASRADVLLRYLDYFREQVVAKVAALPGDEARRSRLPSGWTPLELARHLAWVELRWLEWGFEGRTVDDPWGDHRDDRWYVAPGETVQEVLAALLAQGERSRVVVLANDFGASGAPGERWAGAAPASLERIALHLVQEYARHLGHLDIVAELAGGPLGE